MRVDTSEPRSCKESLADIATIEDMVTGDYAWASWRGESVGWERKYITDLLSSLGSGRLADQLRRLATEFDVAGILGEGPIEVDREGNILDYYWSTKNGRRAKVNKTTNWKLRHVQVAVYSFMRLLGVNYLYSPSIQWTPHIIRWLYEWDQRPYHTGIYTAPKKDLHVPTPGAVALAGLVGPKRAHLLLAKFGTMRQVCQASKTELLGVRGIGEGAVNKLEAGLDQYYDPKGSIFHHLAPTP